MDQYQTFFTKSANLIDDEDYKNTMPLKDTVLDSSWNRKKIILFYVIDTELLREVKKCNNCFHSFERRKLNCVFFFFNFSSGWKAFCERSERWDYFSFIFFATSNTYKSKIKTIIFCIIKGSLKRSEYAEKKRCYSVFTADVNGNLLLMICSSWTKC